MCVFALVFGFSQSSFSGIERRESYRVQVKFFSGGVDSATVLAVRFDFISGNASKYDNKVSYKYTVL